MMVWNFEVFDALLRHGGIRRTNGRAGGEGALPLLVLRAEEFGTVLYSSTSVVLVPGPSIVLDGRWMAQQSYVAPFLAKSEKNIRRDEISSAVPRD